MPSSSDRKELVRNVVVGVLTAVVLGALALAFTKTRSLYTHVDREERVSALVVRLDTLEAVSGRFAAHLGEIRQRTEDLDEQQAGMLYRRVPGSVTRDLGRPFGENEFYVNVLGDASDFEMGEHVHITRRHFGTIEARVAGTIEDERESVVGKLNSTAAEGLGISEADGIARVDVRRAPATRSTPS